MEKVMIIQTIDRYLQNQDRAKRAIGCFHPSSLHKSAKELYRIYFDGDADRSFPPRVLRIFDNGHCVHRRIQKYLAEVGILKQTEVPVENEEYNIVGTCDGIIEIGSKQGVLEIKSMNSTQFYSTYQPKPEHLIQINVYMFCLGIPRGCLLYECKNDQELKEFYLKQDNVILMPILEKIRYVQHCIRKRKEPG